MKKKKVEVHRHTANCWCVMIDGIPVSHHTEQAAAHWEAIDWRLGLKEIS